MRVALTIAALALTPAASAQYDKGTWLFEVIGGPVSPSNPSVTVRLYAAFPKATLEPAFGTGNLDIESDDPDGFFSNMQKGLGLGQVCGAVQLGVPSPGGGVDGLIFAQLGVIACTPNTALPLHVWDATWTTDVFTNRRVHISSAGTLNFKIFSSTSQFWPDVQLFPDKFEHGSGVIQVVPSPSGAILLAASSVLAMRRRR